MVALPHQLEPRRLPRLGMVVLQTDETIERDFRSLAPGRCVIHVSRVPCGREVTEATLAAMRAEIPRAASLLPAVEYAVIGYGCTSGAAVIGPERIEELLKERADAAHTTDPVRALVAACEALDVGRLAFVSPYCEAVSDRLRAVLDRRGVETPVFGSFEQSDDASAARVSPASLARAAVQLGGEASVDGVFLSCTNLRTLSIIGEIERRIGKPVLSSNQVMAWRMLDLAGLAPAPVDCGMLMAQDAASRRRPALTR